MDGYYYLVQRFCTHDSHININCIIFIVSTELTVVLNAFMIELNDITNFGLVIDGLLDIWCNICLLFCVEY